MKATSIFLILLVFIAAAGCTRDTQGMHDGYYSAKSDRPDSDGWIYFVTIYVYNNKIVMAEYNARSHKGLSLDWDIQALRRIEHITNIHPRRIMRGYTQELLNRQSLGNILRMPGDTYFYERFMTLAAAAIECAIAGDRKVAEVTFPLGEPSLEHHSLP